VSAAPRQIIFICTGNHYRSRFAEAIFNHHAQRLKLPWSAASRGLATYLVPDHLTLSPHTILALRERGIDLRFTAEEGRQLSEEDLETAALRIALQDGEHRPMIRRQFPQWEDKIEYWHIGDEHVLSPSLALPQIERKVLKLIEECWLKSNRDTFRGEAPPVAS
jgi:protein-tyrosine phosphatase